MESAYIDSMCALAVSMSGCTAAEAGPMAGAAAAELERRLRSGVTPADCLPELIPAGALLTLSYLAAASAAGAVSYSAGDVSVRRRSAAEAGAGADSLRRQAETILAPYLDGGGFVFRGVDG